MQLAKIENRRLALVPETIQHIRNNFPRKIKFCALFGIARSGKSFLVNLFAKSTQFKVSRSTTPCTTGVWISEPVQVGADEYVVFVDSEGTEHGDTSQQHKILALVCLLTCHGGVLIQNEINHGNSNVSSLAMVAQTCKLVTGLEGGWPCIIFLLRNFQLDMEVDGREATPEVFLNHLLSPVNDALDKDRQLIKDCFSVEKRFLFTMPIPTKADLANTGVLPPGDFKDAFDLLEVTVFQKLQVKKIGELECDGNLLATFLEQCQREINEGGDLNIPSAVEATMNALCLKLSEDFKALYTQKIQALVLDGNDQVLNRTHNEIATEVLTSYEQRTQGVFRESVENFKVSLSSYMNEHLVSLQTKNQDIREIQRQKEAAEEAKKKAAEATKAKEEAERKEREAVIAKEEAERQAREKESFFSLTKGFKLNGKRIW